MKLVDWLAVLFICLKLLDQIEWSWWWVTAPIWGSIILGAAFRTPALKWIEDQRPPRKVTIVGGHLRTHG